MATILIVDDNKQNLQVLGNVLHENEYKVVMAKDGPGALRLAIKTMPDLIFLDIMMPDMDGYEVCEQLKADPQTKDIPVIFLTAKTDTDDIVKGFSVGGIDYITKPFKREELLIRLKNHLELVKSKKKIEQQAKELEASNAMKDKIFSVIAHDLRDALGSFREFSNLITDPRIDLSQEDMGEFFQYIKEKSHATFDVLENLLWWSRCQRKVLYPKIKRFDLFTLTNEVIQQLNGTAKDKGVDIVNNVPIATQVIADTDHIQAVIKNLVYNGLKYTNQGGKVEIEVAGENGNTEVTVTDDGIGIPLLHIDDIFDEHTHYSTFGTNNEKGSGLGLILCKELVSLNNGEISVESFEGVGSKFKFTIPNTL